MWPADSAAQALDNATSLRVLALDLCRHTAADVDLSGCESLRELQLSLWKVIQSHSNAPLNPNKTAMMTVQSMLAQYSDIADSTARQLSVSMQTCGRWQHKPPRVYHDLRPSQALAS